MELLPAVALALDAWHRMVAANDFAGAPALLHPQAVFRSPMRHTPYEGGPMTAKILQTVATIFEDFRYERQFHCGSHDVALEFSARVGDKLLKGMDLIRFDDAGKITDFEVMIRPASALAALGALMGEKLAAGTASP